MSQHKKPSTSETIQEFKIHWDLKSRDHKTWPEYTIVTDENLAAVLELLKAGVAVGRGDVLEVKVGKGEE